MLPTSYVPNKEIRKLREMVRNRTYLVRLRTSLKNRIHAELTKRGIRVLRDPFTKRGRTLLRSLGIGNVNDCLAAMDSLDERIRAISEELEKLSQENGDAQLLTTIPGIGYYSALVILAEIGDISRFPSDEKLCSYAGLVPSTWRSGSATMHGHITKQGSKWLRWVLVECVYMHLRYDTKLTRFFHRLARRKGRKVAAVATARKLLKVIYWMLKRKEVFRSNGHA